MSQKDYNEMHKLLKNQVPTDCHNYCKYITELFLGEISPSIFNKKLCVERCIKHRIAKLQLKLNEKIWKKKQTRTRK